jgi:hypothetical protein
MDPATRLVRTLPGNYKKLSEAAEILGVSGDTLRALIQEAVNEGDPAGAPSKFAMMGRTRLYLYTDEDIERIRGVLESRREVRTFDLTSSGTGRPPLYTKEERATRTRLNARAWYYRNRIKKLEEAGAARKEITAAKRRLREVEDELRRTAKA